MPVTIKINHPEVTKCDISNEYCLCWECVGEQFWICKEKGCILASQDVLTIDNVDEIESVTKDCRCKGAIHKCPNYKHILPHNKGVRKEIIWGECPKCNVKNTS